MAILTLLLFGSLSPHLHSGLVLTLGQDLIVQLGTEGGGVDGSVVTGGQHVQGYLTTS